MKDEEFIQLQIKIQTLMEELEKAQQIHIEETGWRFVYEQPIHRKDASR